MTGFVMVAVVVLWVLVLVEGAVILSLVHAVYRLQRAGFVGGEGLTGSPAPDFDIRTTDGRSITNRDWRGKIAGFLFVKPDCSSCNEVLRGQHLQALIAKTGGNVLIVCRGADLDCNSMIQRHEVLVPAVVDAEGRLGEAFQVTGMPMAVLMDPDGIIRSYGQPLSDEEFAALLRSVDSAEVSTT